MNFYVMTLFPEMVEQGMKTSILGRAMEKGLLSLEAVNIRDYTENKHKKVDDYPYGGGAGMLMQAQPVFDCYRAVTEKIRKHAVMPEENQRERRDGSGQPPSGTRVIYLTPQGEKFCQETARRLSKEKNLIFLCGHYEGIDERVLEEIVTDQISIGDYILTGGELPAMVMMDAIARLIPGVLHNEISADFETFYNDLLEYPQYSRPEIWHGKQVPEELLSGDHKRIEAWRLEQSELRTQRKRPDLYARYSRKQHYIGYLLKRRKMQYMDIAESLRRGRGEIVEASESGILVLDEAAGVYMIAAFEEEKAGEVAGWIPEEGAGYQFVVHQECLLKPLGQRFPIRECLPVYQAVYTRKNAVSLPKHITVTPLGTENLEEVATHYHMTDDRMYLEERLRSGNIYGAFIDGKLAGFAGIHQEGSIGMLEVFEEYRRQGIGRGLEAFLINLHLSMGYTPYGMVEEGNEVSLRLQNDLGLCISKECLYWVVT